MSRTLAIVQARLGSTRLPGKVLEEIAGVSMLGRVIGRLSLSRELSAVVVAAPDDRHAGTLRDEAARWGAGFFAGDEDDVLARYVGAARAFDADPVVRITSDCPLIDAGLVDRVVRAYREDRAEPAADLVCNTRPRRWPRGLDTEVISLAALERADACCRDPRLREHVTLPIHTDPRRFRVRGIEGEDDHSHLRWTVDTAEDLRFVRAVYEALGPDAETCGWRELIALLEGRPDLLRINSGVRQKELPS